MERLETFLEANSKLYLYRNIFIGVSGKPERIEIFCPTKIDEINLKIIEFSFCIKFKFKFIEKKDWVELSKIKFKPLGIGWFFVSS